MGRDAKMKSLSWLVFVISCCCWFVAASLEVKVAVRLLQAGGDVFLHGSTVCCKTAVSVLVNAVTKRSSETLDGTAVRLTEFGFVPASLRAAVHAKWPVEFECGPSFMRMPIPIYDSLIDLRPQCSPRTRIRPAS